jgi:hypothetical protein
MAAPIPTDPADHAVDFALRYAEPLDYHAAQMMLDLGIPTKRVGSSDHKNGIWHATFHPHRRDGGGVTPDGRLNLDSGVLNPDLMIRLGPEASGAYARARLRTRMEAAIAHEYEEDQGKSHEYAVQHAPDTELPIGDHARRLLEIIRRAEQSTPPGDSNPLP